MKTLAYLDCPTGIAGDMCLGALVHAGVPLTYLVEQLGKLGIAHEFELRAEPVQRNQQAATKVHVHLMQASHKHTHEPQHQQAHTHTHSHQDHSHNNDHGHPHTHHSASRRLPEIETMIQQANLPKRAEQWSLQTFRTLAQAEATVHGIPPEQVHFHEVGATDAIVDIVGTCLGLDWLNIDTVVCSSLPTGGGTVRCDHGLLPVPAPAVLAMLAIAHVPVHSNGIQKELVTPTGCALATTLATSFGPPPTFTLTKVGLGAGGRNLPIPNILRLWIGTSNDGAALNRHHQTQSTPSPTPLLPYSPTPPRPHSPTKESITHLQTQLDDTTPQAIAYLFEQLFTLGALDVYTQAISMKKNRLGTLLTVICTDAIANQCEALIFKESTTLGIRRTQQTRSILTREMVSVSTPYGKIPIKVARDRSGGTVLNIQPEYENCADVARSHNIPWKQVHQAAMQAASKID
ncbi:MAG: nickel pincer cofactor biosynthesis protein LarC [Cyanobacteria bacterium P01_D01_bin.36]